MWGWGEEVERGGRIRILVWSVVLALRQSCNFDSSFPRIIHRFCRLFRRAGLFQTGSLWRDAVSFAVLRSSLTVEDHCHSLAMQRR